MIPGEKEKANEVIVLARELIEQLERVHDDPQYRGVWECYQNHGGDYSNGIKYEIQLNNLERALNQLAAMQ